MAQADGGRVKQVVFEDHHRSFEQDRLSDQEGLYQRKYLEGPTWLVLLQINRELFLYGIPE